MCPSKVGHRDPVVVCLVRQIADARLVVRPSRTVVRDGDPGPVLWPMLVVDACPYAGPFNPHGHVHFICDPGPRWYRIAPCTGTPYLLRRNG